MRRRDPHASNDLLDRITFEVVNGGYNLLATVSRLEREFDNVNTNSTTIGGYGSGGGGRGSNNKIGVPSSNLIILDLDSGCLSPYLYGEGYGGSGLALMNEVRYCFDVWHGNKYGSVGQRGGTVNTSRVSYRTVVLLGRYCQNDVFVTNSVVSTANSGAEGGSVRRRRYTPALGGLWRVSDMQLMFDILGDVYDDTDTSASLEVPGMCNFQ